MLQTGSAGIARVGGERNREPGLALSSRKAPRESLNTFTRSALAKLLERHGIAVDAVSNGREAVALYGQANYAAVLMDCQMPEMDGYEAARRIREVEKDLERRTPVIAVTALTMAGECLRCQAAGMDDYLVKPVAPAALFECIAAHLVGKSESAQDGATA